MAKITILALLAASITAVYASPMPQTTSEPATVNFTPYAGPGCDMSTNPFDTTKPVSYNLTSSSGCITPPYAFDSYVEEANALAADGPCSVSIFSGPGCTGDVHAATLTTYTDCIAGGDVGGQSIEMACGP